MEIKKTKVKGFFNTSQTEEITREQLEVLLWGLLHDISIKEFANMITNKFFSCIEYAQLINGVNINTPMTLLFNPHRLDITTKQSKITLYKSLKDKSKISGLARVALHKGILSKKGLLNIISLGFNGVSYVQDFLAYVARDLCKKYNVDKDSKVLDPCGGWGGRMIGTSVVCNHYEAFEPSTKTAKGLKALHLYLQSMNTDFKAIVHTLPFEESKIKKHTFDFALTSPPYYDTEHYSTEETNSLNKYKSFGDWCEGFYYPLISKTMKALKKDGTFILNIGNRKYPLTEKLYVHFEGKYNIKELKKYISNTSAQGRKKNKGETFYEITYK